MSVYRISFLFLLIGMGLCVIVLSQLDSATVGKVYGVASQALRIDLQAYKIDTVQISNAGHVVAGFVLCGLGQLVFRRWWVLPLMLVFFVALEVAQHFSPDRQADILDVMRGGVGALLGFVSASLVLRFKNCIYPERASYRF